MAVAVLLVLAVPKEPAMASVDPPSVPVVAVAVLPSLSVLA